MANSNLDPELVERIVREVMRRLLDRGITVSAASETSNGCDLQIADKVVALASFDGKLNGIRRVLIGSRAIITPAAKDELRDRGIELVRSAGL